MHILIMLRFNSSKVPKHLRSMYVVIKLTKYSKYQIISITCVFNLQRLRYHALNSKHGRFLLQNIHYSYFGIIRALLYHVSERRGRFLKQSYGIKINHEGPAFLHSFVTPDGRVV